MGGRRGTVVNNLRIFSVQRARRNIRKIGFGGRSATVFNEKCE